ncbi:MAG: hypothetical protein VX737_05555 [Pseudomonadota bacterium]|nr:hypothetical protein [Pseudomonadota bacterium]
MNRKKILCLVLACVLFLSGCSSDNGRHNESIDQATYSLAGAATGALVSAGTDWGAAPIIVGLVGGSLIGAKVGRGKDKVRYAKYPELSRGFQKMSPEAREKWEEERRVQMRQWLKNEKVISLLNSSSKSATLNWTSPEDKAHYRMDVHQYEPLSDGKPINIGKTCRIFNVYKKTFNGVHTDRRAVVCKDNGKWHVLRWD